MFVGAVACNELVIFAPFGMGFAPAAVGLFDPISLQFWTYDISAQVGTATMMYIAAAATFDGRVVFPAFYSGTRVGVFT
eukprot:5058301-Prymnesium_polylepis.1